MNLGFEVLSVHENVQKALRRIKAEDSRDVSGGVVYEMVFVVILSGVQTVVSVDDLGDSHADIPDNFGRGLLLVVQFISYYHYYFVYMVFYFLCGHYLLCFLIKFFLLMV